jgi:glycosyltransferase involved in cell wall biosynthesis
LSVARIASHRDFGRNLERRANECVSGGTLPRPDVILASLPPLDSPEAAARLARRHNARLIVDIMDLWPETFERLLPGPDWLRRLASPLLLGRMRARRRAIIAAADGISAATHTYLDTTLAGSRSDVPRHVCYLGADMPAHEVTAPEADESRHARASTAGSPPCDLTASPGKVGYREPAVNADNKRRRLTASPGKADRPLECVYAGTLERGQDLQTLIDAARILARESVPVTLHVAGTGSLEPMLREAAATIAGRCELKVHGLLAKPEYEQLLAQCDVGLVLVKPESCVAVPYKACDYAAAGLALVNSLPGELQQLIDDHRAGIASTAGDAASLAAAIRRLAADRPLVATMRQGSRRLAAAEFDRSHTFPRFAEWIEAVHAGDGK